jgi:4-diphosphocytidyl-2-C-methyl-D-erythritol kinase
MIVYPHSKINLGLHVIRKRNDGFHELETLFYPLDLCDALEIIPAEDGKTAFTSGGIPIPEDGSDNLCVKAWKILQKDYPVPAVKIHLHKMIPVGAGLGGGSSDAAFTLKVLNDLFDLKLSAEMLHQYAQQLGSDCSFFLQNSPVYATGRGEIMTSHPLSLRGYSLVLVKPGVHVSTADAYAGITPGLPEKPLREILSLPPERWKDLLVNDFEKTILRRFPEIDNIKSLMYDLGAVYACMSGSGSSVFGIFRGKPPENISQAIPNYFFWQQELK